MDKPSGKVFGYTRYFEGGHVEIGVSPQQPSHERQEAFDSTIAVMYELLPFLLGMQIVERNYSELVSSLDEHHSALQGSPEGVIMVIPVDRLVVANQRISNFLSAASAFLSGCETRIGDQRGRPSPEATAWKTKSNELHAAHFAYRFLYELRNFSQHAHLPLSFLDVGSKRSEDEGKDAFTVGLILSRQGLFEPSYRWNKKVRAELESYDAEFDISPMLPIYLDCIRRLCLEGLRPMAQRLAVCDDYLRELAQSLQLPAGSVPMRFSLEPAAEGILLTNGIVVPYHDRNWIVEEWRRLMKECRLP